MILLRLIMRTGLGKNHQVVHQALVRRVAEVVHLRPVHQVVPPVQVVVAHL